MKMSCIIFFSLFLSACSTFHLKVNRNKKHTISTVCGKLEISVETTRYHSYRIRFKSIEGSFDLNMDSIGHFVSFSDYYHPDLLRINHSLGNSKVLKKNETLEVSFIKFQIDDRDFPLNTIIRYTLNLAPGNYIRCNGADVITDTLIIRR